jgi:hypothetical protein
MNQTATTANEMPQTATRRRKRSRTPVNKGREMMALGARVPKELVERLKAFVSSSAWPPRPSQSEIVTRGIETVLDELEGVRK